MSVSERVLALDSPEIESLGCWALSILPITLKVQQRILFQFLSRPLGVIILIELSKLVDIWKMFSSQFYIVWYFMLAIEINCVLFKFLNKWMHFYIKYIEEGLEHGVFGILAVFSYLQKCYFSGLFFEY